MAIVKFPELTLKVLLDSILGLIKNDYINASDKAQSFMGKLYSGLIIGNFDVFQTAVDIFNWSNSDPRRIDTRLMFDKDRANIPTIHINIPSQDSFGDGIGMDEGFQAPVLSDDETSLNEYLTRAYNMKFELYVTGANEFETVIIYNTVKAALINNIPSLELNGFSNAKIYGSDLKINDQHTPILFVRVINLDCNFELNIPKFNSISVVNDINFTGTAYDN